jgi:alkylation response protein AidB-like acyl-CoA dehydrogenase
LNGTTLQRAAIFEEEHDVLREAVRRFISTQIAPHHARWEQNGIVDRDLWRRAGDIGLLCPTVPTEYGGLGADFRYNAIIGEELSRAFATGPLFGFMAHSDIAVSYLIHYGSEELKARILPGMISGEIVGAIAMTEPGTGSDLAAISTTATRDGDSYILNGSKTFISNGQCADVAVVVARIQPTAGSKKLSLFLIETDRPGFSRGRKLEKIGLKAQDTSELFFSGLRLPSSNLIGREHEAFEYLIRELPQERLAIAISAVGACEGAFAESLAYVQQRKAFGRRLFDFQNTRFTLAGLRTEIAAGRAFLDHCLQLHLSGQLDPAGAAMCKLHTTELQGRVLDACVQLFGGYGYMSEYPIARAYVDARVQRIYGGTSEIMKEVISRSL